MPMRKPRALSSGLEKQQPSTLTNEKEVFVEVLEAQRFLKNQRNIMKA